MGVIAAATLGLKGFALLIMAFFVLTFIADNEGPAQYKDVSHEQEHTGWVGQRCTVLKGLRAHGVTADSWPQRGITDYVDITTLPGIGGPEITFTVPIHKGMDMLITRVEQCTTCRLFGFGRIRYAVTVIPKLRELAPYRVFVGTSELAPDQVHCVTNVSPAG